MKTHYNSMLLSSLLILIFSSFPAHSTSSSKEPLIHAGQISKYEGNILYRKDGKSKPLLIKQASSPLEVGNQLRTKKNSTAYIKWKDGSKIVVTEKSQLSIKEVDHFNVDNGKVIFDIAKLERPRPVQVGVKMSILGIRGTKFIVTDEGDDYNVYLKEGNITITALEDEFKIYQDQIESQMEAFKKQLEQEVSKFKSMLKSEFDTFTKEAGLGEVDLVKEFKLVEAAGIAIKDGVLTLIPIPKEIEDEFKLLEEF